MIPTEHRRFLEDHRLAVVGFDRQSGPPALSPVYYVLDGDDILISTTATRAKAKAARRQGEVTLCVLHEQMPFSYLGIYGEATVEDEGGSDLMMRIGERMSGNPIAEAARPALEERARNEGRIVLRVKPTRFYATQAIGARSA
jgi:PPOX class probable F420-dependent enzyme